MARPLNAEMSAAALVLLALAWLLALAPPLSLLGSEQARNHNEGGNTVKQQEVLDGLALSREPNGLTLTNDPPLSCHLVAALSGLTGLPLLSAGRLAALAAARLGAGAAGAAAAGLAFGVMAMGTAPSFVGANEPHLLGLAFALAGLVPHLSPSGPRVAPAALCFAAALAVKLCFVGAVAAIAADLALRREARLLARYALWGGLAGAVVAAWTLFGEGPHALGQLFVPRSVSIYTAINNVTLFLPVALPLLLGAGLALVAGLRERPPRAALLAALAVLPWPIMLFFAAGHGVAPPIFLEAIALTLVAFFAAIALPRMSAGPAGGLALLLPASGAAAIVLIAGWEHLRSAGERKRLAALRQQAVALVAASPGPAMCEDILLCHQAGKPHLYDAYAVDNAVRAGRLSDDEIAQMFRDRRFAVIKLGVDQAVNLEGAGAMFRFPAPVAQAIRENHVAVIAHPRLAVLTPRN